MVVTPDGKTVYATSKTLIPNSKTGADQIVTWITPVDVATNAVGKSIKVRAGQGSLGNKARLIAITPDGGTAYLYGGPDVIPVSLRSGKVFAPITAGNQSVYADFAITPNGDTAYANAEASGLLPIDTRTQKPLSPVYLPAGYEEGVAGEAFDVSGNVLYLPAYIARPSGANEGALIPIDTATQRFGKIIKIGPGITEQVVTVP